MIFALKSEGRNDGWGEGGQMGGGEGYKGKQAELRCFIWHTLLLKLIYKANSRLKNTVPHPRYWLSFKDRLAAQKIVITQHNCRMRKNAHGRWKKYKGS